MSVGKHFFLIVFYLCVCFVSQQNAFASSHSQYVSDIISPEEAKVLNAVKDFLSKYDRRHIIYPNETKVSNDEKNYQSKNDSTFDFTLKKVAFYTGEGADVRSNKLKYIQDYEIWTKDEPNNIPYTIMYIFDAAEKKRADGYDAVIVFGTVKPFPSKNKLIRRLRIAGIFK